MMSPSLTCLASSSVGNMIKGIDGPYQSLEMKTPTASSGSGRATMIAAGPVWSLMRSM